MRGVAMTVRKRFIGVFAAMLLVAGALVGTASPAEASMRYGTVICTGGEVVGIWVEQPGNSGWAPWNRTGYGSANWHYNFNGNNYQVHVGCGGSPQHWASSNKSAWVNNSWASGDFVCDVGRRICALS